MKARIQEIFQSIQGEGKYAGVLQTFVRFFECHMHCAWCDTPDSIGDGKREYREYTPGELGEAIHQTSGESHSVSLTGGEPLLQADFIKEFIPVLNNKIKIYLETSGVLYQALEKIIDGVDIIAMDFKLPSSTKCRPFWKEHEEFLKIARKKDVFIKTVVSSATKEEDVAATVDIIQRISPETLLVLQPNYFEVRNGAVKRCHEFYALCARNLPNVRVMPQMHKMMGLR